MTKHPKHSTLSVITFLSFFCLVLFYLCLRRVIGIKLSCKAVLIFVQSDWRHVARVHTSTVCLQRQNYSLFCFRWSYKSSCATLWLCLSSQAFSRGKLVSVQRILSSMVSQVCWIHLISEPVSSVRELKKLFT